LSTNHTNHTNEDEGAAGGLGLNAALRAAIDLWARGWM
jgi:hypothetical protein